MSTTNIDQDRLLATTDAAVWAEEFQKLVANGVEIDEGLMIGWFANAMAVAEREANNVEHDRSVEAFRFIAQFCSHEETGDFTADHLHEPTTGGVRFCGPCHAWRVLNGSPDAVD